jgi:hypothetical protein
MVVLQERAPACVIMNVSAASPIRFCDERLANWIAAVPQFLNESS